MKNIKYWKSIKVDYNDNEELWGYVLDITQPYFLEDSLNSEPTYMEIGIDDVKELVNEHLYTYLYEDRLVLAKEIVELIEFMLELGYEAEQIGEEAYLVDTKETKNISDIMVF